MGLIDRDDGWRMPEWLWEKIEPLLPPPPPHPLGTHRPRIPNRRVMDAILLVLRTGMQWNALRVTGICNSSTAHRRFQEWEQAGVFHEIWRQGLLDYDEAVGIDWSFLACDGALSKAPQGAYSAPSRSPIPPPADHRFRSKPITGSAAKPITFGPAGGIAVRPRSDAWQRSVTLDLVHESEGGRGGVRETVHAKDKRGPAPQVRRGPFEPPDRPGDRHLVLDGLGDRGAPEGRGARLAAA